MPNHEVNQPDIPLQQEVVSEIGITPDGIAAANEFLAENATHLGRIFGVSNLSIRVGKGWATFPETGEVTADPSFFTEKGYTTEMAAYATMHEVAAHLKELVQEPVLSRDVERFLRNERQGNTKKAAALRGEAADIFYNIFSDIAGNNLIHATLPATKEIAAELYREKQFPDDPIDTLTGMEVLYADQPRHIQFLYKIIRQEMIPGSETEVLPEVDEAINGFRAYSPPGFVTSFDLLKFSTAVAKEDRTDMPPRARFNLWANTIYPKFLELFETDTMDPQFQNKEPKPGEGQPVGPADGQKVDPNNADFSKQYADYHTNKHPEPMTKEQQKAIHRHAEKVQRTTERANRDARDPMKQLDKQLKETIGHSLTELKAYQAETEKWRTEIDAMRDVYKLLIHERVTTRRRLKGGHTEGAMLNPETIAQTIMDVRSGSHYPPAFMDYERSRGERETSGKTAWVFVFDRSGSMQDGGRSVAAASSLVICLEGLAAMQRDIDTAEEEASADLDLGIQTAVYTFNGIIDCPKPLSAGLSEKERLDAYSLVSNPDGINADSVILGKIEDLKIQDGWRKVLVVVSDGEADDQSASKASIDLLRKSAWQVFGIAIGSKAAELLYAPDSQRVDNPTNLPQAMQTLVQKNLT